MGSFEELGVLLKLPHADCLRVLNVIEEHTISKEKVRQAIEAGRKTIKSDDCLYSKEVKEAYLWCLDDLEEELGLDK